MPNFQTLTTSKANNDDTAKVSKEEEDKRSQLLREIKSWERDFQVLFRRKPSRSDVCLDERVRKMYSEFKRFKSRGTGTDSNAAKTGSGRTSFVTATTITAAASSDDRKSNAKTKEVEERARDVDVDDDDVVVHGNGGRAVAVPRFFERNREVETPAEPSSVLRAV
jgi:hypothetical protein